MWILLIFFYPHSRPIQAFFFWNRWVRWFFGFGYVNLLLAWVPFLRRRLFQPFRIPLTADAQLDAFDPKTYFPGSQVRSAQSRKLQLLVEAIPEITGQMVVEGESGLGKTMYMRHLLFRSKRVVVYLSATKCAKGVMSAIQAKLQGPARDSTPMRCMSPSGYKRLQRPHFR